MKEIVLFVPLLGSIRPVIEALEAALSNGWHPSFPNKSANVKSSLPWASQLEAVNRCLIALRQRAILIEKSNIVSRASYFAAFLVSFPSFLAIHFSYLPPSWTDLNCQTSAQRHYGHAAWA